MQEITTVKMLQCKKNAEYLVRISKQAKFISCFFCQYRFFSIFLPSLCAVWPFPSCLPLAIQCTAFYNILRIIITAPFMGEIRGEA